MEQVRWKQRFQNFEQAYQVFLRRHLEFQENRDKEAYQMALVQSFGIVLEIAWKTLKNYLEYEGYEEFKNSKHAVRTAFQDGIIQDTEVWMKAIQIRNLTSHVYNLNVLNETLDFIDSEFSFALKDLFFQLKGKL